MKLEVQELKNKLNSVNSQNGNIQTNLINQNNNNIPLNQKSNISNNNNNIQNNNNNNILFNIAVKEIKEICEK